MTGTVVLHDLHLTTPEAFDAAYAEAIRLVQTHRAASISLVQRYLCVGYEPARALLARMVRETTFVRTMPGDLYMYAPEPLASELKALHAFVNDVLARSTQGPIDPDTVRSLGTKYALQDYLRSGNNPHTVETD